MTDETDVKRVVVEAKVEGGRATATSLKDIAKSVAGLRKELSGLTREVQTLVKGLAGIGPATKKAMQEGTQAIRVSSKFGAAQMFSGIDPGFSRTSGFGTGFDPRSSQAAIRTSQRSVDRVQARMLSRMYGAPAVGIGQPDFDIEYAHDEGTPFVHGRAEMGRNVMLARARGRFLKQRAQRDLRSARARMPFGGLGVGGSIADLEMEMAAGQGGPLNFANLPRGRYTPWADSREGRSVLNGLEGRFDESVRARDRRVTANMRQLSRIHARGQREGLAGVRGRQGWAEGLGVPMSRLAMAYGALRLTEGVMGGAAQYAMSPILHGVGGIGAAYEGGGGAIGAIGGMVGGAMGGAMLGGIGAIPGAIFGGTIGLFAGRGLSGAFGSAVQSAVLMGEMGMDFRRGAANELFARDPAAYREQLYGALGGLVGGTRAQFTYSAPQKVNRIPPGGRVLYSGTPSTTTMTRGTMGGEPGLLGVLSLGRNLGYTARETTQIMGQAAATSGGWADAENVIEGQKTALLLKRGLGVDPSLAGKMIFGVRRGGLPGAIDTGTMAEDLYRRGARQVGLSGAGELREMFDVVGRRMDEFHQTGRSFDYDRFLAQSTMMANRGLGGVFGMQRAAGLTDYARQVSASGPSSFLDVLALRTMGGLPAGGVSAGQLLQGLQNLENPTAGGQAAFLRGITESGGGLGGGGPLLMHLLGNQRFGSSSVAISRALAGGGGPFGGAGGTTGGLTLAQRAAAQGDPAMANAAAITDQQLQAGIQLTDTMILFQQAAANLSTAVGDAAAKIENSAMNWNALSGDVGRFVKWLAEN